MKYLLFILFLVFAGGLFVFLYTWYRLHTKLNLHTQSSKKEINNEWKTTTKFVTNEHGQKIAYLYYPIDKPKAVVILVHGHSNPGGKNQMLVHAKYLKDAAYSTVLLDLHSYGESEGSKQNLGTTEWKDIEAVYDEIKTFEENKNIKVGFFGISMGAVSSLVTAGKTGKGDFVIASVPYADLNSLFKFQVINEGLPPQIFYPFLKLAGMFELGFKYNDNTPKAVIKNIKAPLFIVSAKHDEDVNASDAKVLFEMANEPKELWEAESGHDVHRSNPEEFEKRILDFLETLK